MKSTIAIVLTVMILLFLYSCAPYISGQLAEAEKELVATHEKVGVVEGQKGGRPPRRVEMVYGECRRRRPIGRVQVLRPDTMIAVSRGYVINQPPIRGPLR